MSNLLTLYRSVKLKHTGFLCEATTNTIFFVPYDVGTPIDAVWTKKLVNIVPTSALNF